jgi:hypothetical protein
MANLILNPKLVAERGEDIYRKKFKAVYEPRYNGQFVAIDVNSEDAYLGPTPQQAYANARQAAQRGIFHLMKVGEAGAYRVSYSADGDLDWFSK